MRLEKLTRKSIRKYMIVGPALSRGSGNPITMHAVDEKLFAGIWSMVAEVMVAESSLDRKLKEKIASQVSLTNSCQLCVKIHEIMEKAAPRVEDDQASILTYVHSIQTVTAKECPRPDLNISWEKKLEAALVVLLFQYMNRSVSCLLEEEMSTTIFGVPKLVARPLEKGTSMRVITLVMKSLFRGKMSRVASAGLTDNLFSNDEEMTQLPPNLVGVEATGCKRARAVKCLISWTKSTYSRSLQKYISHSLLCYIDNLVDDYLMPPVRSLVSNIAAVRSNLESKFSPFHTPSGMVLLIVALEPKALKQSLDFAQVVNRIGKDETKLLVLWCSLRHSLRKAEGLDEMPKECALK